MTRTGATRANGSDDPATLVAIGVAVALCASLAHEALGHGLGCLADGGTVILLTFSVFRCAGAGVLTDGGGPIGALVVAGLCLGVVRAVRPPPSAKSLFCYAMGIQTLLWVWAQMVSEGIDGSDDWGHVALDMGWTPAWRGAAIVVGAIGYATTIRLAASLGLPLARGRPLRLLIPYASACVAALALDALSHGATASTMLATFLSFGAAPLGYLLAIRVIARAPIEAGDHAIRFDAAWLITVTIAALIFALTIGRGIGRLA